MHLLILSIVFWSIPVSCYANTITSPTLIEFADLEHRLLEVNSKLLNLNLLPGNTSKVASDLINSTLEFIKKHLVETPASDLNVDEFKEELLKIFDDYDDFIKLIAYMNFSPSSFTSIDTSEQALKELYRSPEFRDFRYSLPYRDDVNNPWKAYRVFFDFLLFEKLDIREIVVISELYKNYSSSVASDPSLSVAADELILSLMEDYKSDLNANPDFKTNLKAIFGIDLTENSDQ